MKKNTEKYVVNIVFEKRHEKQIREVAKEQGLPVATFIKQCVLQEIKNKQETSTK